MERSSNSVIHRQQHPRRIKTRFDPVELIEALEGGIAPLDMNAHNTDNHVLLSRPSASHINE